MSLPNEMIEVTRLTRSGRLAEAGAALRRMLEQGRAPGAPPTIDGVAERLDGSAAPSPRSWAGAPIGVPPMSVPIDVRAAGGPGALRALLDRLGADASGPARAGGAAGASAATVPDGAEFRAGIFSNEAGSRPYKLYVPGHVDAARPAPLIVMLHGCTQSPDDFALGTRMNEAAEAQGCFVVYPGQTSAANMQKCWNWFNKGDQRRGGGEPSLIAGITRDIMARYPVDPARVYVAGLSAGGAAAAVMGAAYPDLYAAIGVHSGLACGAAGDMQSAFAVMQRGGAGTAPDKTRPGRRLVPAIVLHGDRDTTVNARNGDAVVAQSAQAEALRTRSETGQVPGGHAYTRTLHAAADGRTLIEQWVVHGAGHAWFGGSPAGSYTDPKGPDATGAMLRFFLEHPAAG